MGPALPAFSEEINVHKILPKTLFPYQQEGAAWLAARKTALLADPPRMGKAVQSIAAIDLLGATKVLIVCRGVARANWRSEFIDWSKRNWTFGIAYGGDFTLPSELHLGTRPCAIITNYENLESVIRLLPAGFKFDVSVIDESHFVKNLEAQRSQHVFGKNGVPKFTKRHWCTTGTPAPNGLASELWTTLFTYGLTKLPFWEFAHRYCHVKETGYGPKVVGTKIPGPANTDAENREYTAIVKELQQLMAPKVLRREAHEVAVQLPKMSFSTQMVQAGNVNLRETTFWKYAMREGGLKEFEELVQQELGIMNALLPAEGDERLLSHELLETLKAEAKSISTLRKYTALQKLEPACELIASELESNAYRKCVIFAHHRDLINGAARILHKFGPVTLYGGTKPSSVARNLKNFQNPNHRTRVFIGQISAAGTSISLSAANHIFFLEESFTPEDNAQAAMRCGGVNQPNPIFVRTFCLENSYDYRLQNILRQKTKEAAAIFGKPLTAEVPPELADMI